MRAWEQTRGEVGSRSETNEGRQTGAFPRVTWERRVMNDARFLTCHVAQIDDQSLKHFAGNIGRNVAALLAVRFFES